MCCNVLMFDGVTGWGKGGIWKGLRKGVFMCCNVGMCGVVPGCWRGRVMERVTERWFYVL